MYSARSETKMRAGESEHVLAQFNVWEIKSKKQMAAWGWREEERGRRAES